MNKNQLTAAGLTPQQADVYWLLIKEGSVSPPKVAKELSLTRSNAYKILDKLVTLGLAKKSKESKKTIYTAGNPMSLNSFVMEARNQVSAKEEALHSIMDDLLTMYYEKNEQPTIQTVSGQQAVFEAYKQQLDLNQSVYFVRSQADISSMGFNKMEDIRRLASNHGSLRFGIIPRLSNSQINQFGDKYSNLKRTWVNKEDYTAPVEWSVSGSMLLIVLFAKQPHAIVITNPIIAAAFKQLWQIMAANLNEPKLQST